MLFFQLALLVLVALVFVYCVHFLVLSAREWSIFVCLKRFGILAEAKILDLGIKGQGRDTSYFVAYQLSLYEGTYERNQIISTQHQQWLRRVDTVIVSYLPNNPTISRLADADQDGTERFRITIVCFVGLVILPPLVLLWFIIFLGSNLQLTGRLLPMKKKKLSSP
jgi:hypothetical protein